MRIDAEGMDHMTLNQRIRDCAREGNGEVFIDNCLGQRFIAAGQNAGRITVNGTPGNAMGAYLDGAEIVVNGNAQDAVGDTMNGGGIIVHGDIGDALGYAMRGGRIYVRGNSGYRTGIHMKEYRDKCPVIIIGGGSGSFLGEYLAGGIIIVLGLDAEEVGARVGNFCGTGMHGGRIFLRCGAKPDNLPEQVWVEEATEGDMADIRSEVRAYAEVFSLDFDGIINSRFYVLKPSTANTYKRLYVAN